MAICPWKGHRLGAVLRAHVGKLHGEELGRLSLDVVDRDDALFLAQRSASTSWARSIDISTAREGAEGDHPGQGTFDLADVGL
jgi:hypothetical protein